MTCQANNTVNDAASGKIPAQLHKFGGSSLADADGYRRVAHILLTQGESSDWVVVSAAGTTTNQLYQLLALADAGELWQQELSVLMAYQQQLVEQLLSGDAVRELRERLAADKAQLQSLLQLAVITDGQRAQLLGFGEHWSARLLAALLRHQGVCARDISAIEVLKADCALIPNIDSVASMANITQLIAQCDSCRLIITGFLCGGPDGETVLLGRNGSDFSASQIAALAGIPRCTIWTDVPGVFNADPNLIVDAALLPVLSLTEANRLAGLGSAVLHRRTLQPLFDTEMSLAVRSSFTPEADFTLITRHSHSDGQAVITTLPSVWCFTLADVDGDVEIDALLAQLADLSLTPLAWWQHHNRVELAYSPEQGQALQVLLHNDSLSLPLQRQLDKEMGLVALVSAQAGDYRQRFSQLLQRQAYSLYQDDVSLVTLVPTAQVARLSRRLHRSCAAARHRIGLVLFGPGNIGQTWLAQFFHQQKALAQQLGAELTLHGVVNSRQALICREGLTEHNWSQRLIDTSQGWQYPALLDELSGLPCDELVALDISASESLSEEYGAFFQRGMHMISANKLAGSASQAQYLQLQQALAVRHVLWRQNASCGAALPVQAALRELRLVGDKVEAISGIFSGTLSWLFSHYDGTVPFSHLLLDALAQGITEPDPREDLSGRDMQRKLLILARELGLPLALTDIRMHNPVPDTLSTVPLATFLQRANELDAPLAAALDKAREQGQVLRYIAQLEWLDGRWQAAVGLMPLPPAHPCATLLPGDNAFIIRSRLYRDNPLVIRGPGAGREVTAAAVQSDLVYLCRELLRN